MSFRQTIEVFHPVDVQRYLEVLKNEFGATVNPSQPGTYLIDNPPLPFYEPLFIEDHLTIVSFNYMLLSPMLLKALALHPELAPPDAAVRWLDEQDLAASGTVEALDWRLRGREQE